MGAATRGLWICVFITAIALAGCGSAQNRQPIPPSAQIAAPLKLCAPPAAPPTDLAANPGFIQFEVSVTDAAGRPVTGLKSSEFEAHAGSQSLPIRYFHEEPDGAPTSIAIVIDLSGLMAIDLVPHLSKVDAVQNSLPDAFDRMNACDEVAILVFGGDEMADERIGQTPNPAPYQSPGETPIRLLQPFTTDDRLALTSLHDRTTGGLSPLYDAIQQGLNVLQSAHYPNRGLIVITDGVDDTSAVKKEDLIASVNASGVPAYVVELGEPYARAYGPPQGLVIRIPLPGNTGNAVPGNTPSANSPCAKYKCVDSGTLAKLTAPNGGRLLIVPHPTYDPRVTLSDELKSTVADLDHGYSIGLVTPAGSALPEITVANRPQVKVRAHVIHTREGAR